MGPSHRYVYSVSESHVTSYRHSSQQWTKTITNCTCTSVRWPNWPYRNGFPMTTPDSKSSALFVIRFFFFLSFCSSLFYQTLNEPQGFSGEKASYCAKNHVWLYKYAMEEWTILGVGGWVGNNLEKIIFLQEQMEGKKERKRCSLSLSLSLSSTLSLSLSLLSLSLYIYIYCCCFFVFFLEPCST